MSTNWIKDTYVLSNCLQHLNSVQEKNTPIDRYRSMFEGLNQLYKEYYYHKNLVNIQNNHRAEKKSFKQLVKENLESNEKHSLINSREFTDFLEIDPTIMDEEIRRKHPAYNPRTITDDVIECASKYHIQLKKPLKILKLIIVN